MTWTKDIALWLVWLIAGVLTIPAGIFTFGALFAAAASNHPGGPKWAWAASLGVSLMAGLLTDALAKLTLYCHRRL